ncbi:AAA family ATPase [Veillonella sp.]|uniref:AAA family ATPase n=1 Tax=Veillonella sp. TaxID=1926307 RepID=UPI0025ED5843|nr:ATP-binding protein [Veillonella sp.]
MILNFAIEGFTSFNERQEISFTAFNKQRIKNTKYEENYVLESPFRECKSILFFGNNAVGKTNVILALSTLRYILNTGKFPDPRWFNWYNTQMGFELVVSKGRDYYEYRIKINRDGYIVSEALLKNEENIFTFDSNILQSELLDNKIEEIYSIRSTSPVLLKLKDFIHKEYDEFMEAVKKISVVITNSYDLDDKGLRYEFSEITKQKIETNKALALELLQQIDSSIVDISFKLYDLEEKTYEIYLHRYSRRENNNIKQNIVDESSGVKKIVSLLAKLLSIYDGETLVIDELDSSISTRSLMLIYNNMINNGRNRSGQLIVSTHNLELLNLDLFAPEQIYILSKNDCLSTEINSLADFDLRSSNKRLAVKFLQREFEV